MKLSRIISLLLALTALTLIIAGCNFGNNESTTSTTVTTKNDWDDLYEIITIAEAIEIAKGASTPTEAIYYIRGTIVTISNPDYGSMTISDGTDEISIYNTKGQDDTYFSNLEDAPVKGDEVLLLCSLQNYNGTLEVKQAYLVDFIKADKEDIDTSDYTEMTIADAREVALGTKVRVTGVVARITYANGMKPSGVYVVDGTNSIYVYDGDIAGQVSIGNKITVLGEKDYWVLADESNAANKHGYKGCCQISSATLYENDKATNEIDFSWCEELTVKEMLNIPVTENVTTTIFKTNALVKKVPGNGFVNYYFFDLDGNTGAYTYTQCNGSDFKWLDEFDGKICTVYLSPMNAKSTTSDCYFRFLPVAVIDEGFVFDLANTPAHIVEYYGVDQFLSTYTGNPVLELVTSVSSELLGFENATLSYSSSDENVVYFTEEDGKLILNCGANGTATVTITGTYGEYTYETTVEITVDVPVASESITVGAAIETAVGETVRVEGIVGPSLVNQKGFYLIDETGAIPVRVDATQFEGLAIGQKVIVEGTISITKDGGGQFCIDNAIIVTNYYGKNDYSTDSFIKNATMEDIKALPDDASSTTNVYVITALVQKTSTQNGNYTNVTFNVGEVLLYSGSAAQYSWLENFFAEGENSATLTVELAICDWNNKGLKGCVLAVITAEGKVYNELNFQ